jgi:hypothetical protein
MRLEQGHQAQDLRGREIQELREQGLAALKQAVGGDVPEIRERLLEQLIMQDTGLPQKLKIAKWQERKAFLVEEQKRRGAGTALDIVFHQLTNFRPLVPFVEMLGYHLQTAELDPQRDMFYSST